MNELNQSDRDSAVEHEQFGSSIGGSRWFNQNPNVSRKEVKTFREIWTCPIDGCEGEMVFNGLIWPTGQPGYHHTCKKCGFTAAIHDKFPRIEIVDV